jgi:integrase
MASSPSAQLDPYVVLRGAGQAPWFRRRIPEHLRAVIGSSTITLRLAGSPTGSLAERQKYLASYRRALVAADERLGVAASSCRKLSATEQLGIAGHWAATAPPRPADPTDAAETAAILAALQELGLVLPCPVPTDWQPGPIDATDHQLAETALRLAHQIEGLDHPGEVHPPPPEWIWGQQHPTPAAALSWLADVVQQAAAPLTGVLQQARTELQRLGVVVGADQQQQVAHRLAVAAAALSQQQAQLEAGTVPPPISWPPPPEPNSSSATFELALARWTSLRSPTSKTRLDAQARLQELAAHAGTDRLEGITAEHVSSWRDLLLQTATPATVKRRLGLVRAVLKAAASDGLPIAAQVLERLGTPISGSSGTAVQRRPFTNTEAALLWRISREQQGPRPLDRWAIPLGLSLGCRLEELAGLRPQDVRQIEGQWVVVIEPHEHRRLKNNNSARTVPIPEALIAEEFTSWVQQQSGPLLFPEPEPPAADPRRSHYASTRLSKLIRKQAGITDPAAVFHSCRHTAAQSLVDAGCEQRLIEQLMGHSTRSMTARYSRAGLPIEQLAAAQESRDWCWVPPQD